jgi:hypothetical protein
VAVAEKPRAAKPSGQYLLKSGAPAHVLTDEDRRKSAAARKRKAAERRMSRAELAHHKLMQLLEALDPLEAGDRALLLATVREALDRDEGKAVTRVETKSLNVTASLSELSQEQLQALAAHAPRPELPPAA